MPKKIVMNGKRFGKLIVIEESDVFDYGHHKWICRCDCGAVTKPIRGESLRNGSTVSCGCVKQGINNEHCQKMGKARRTHGMSRTKIHGAWQFMKQRCSNPNTRFYKCYGGRGIQVCTEWQNSFEAFFSYVSQLPHFGEPGRSLDRINNDGNYEPGNVRWATAKEQQNNKRRYGPRRTHENQEQAAADGRHQESERQARPGMGSAPEGAGR